MTSLTLVADAPPAGILLLDDDEAVRRMTARVLRNAGHRVSDFNNPVAAVDFLATCDLSFDLLVTDFVMPTMTGIEAAACIAVLRPGIAVVYMSGYGPDMIPAEALAPAGRWFLSKPFRGDDLLAHVDAAVAFARVGQ